MATIFNLFCTFSLELKGQLTQNLVGSIGATCRSKIAKLGLALMAQLDACPTSDQEVMDQSLLVLATFFQGMIMKYFLRSFSPFHRFQKGSCQFLAKGYAQVLVYR